MKITKATFLKSCTTINEAYSDKKHEVAFIGRSNVGKSSLINMLFGGKNLAKTSQTPGKTQLINYFSINDSWYLVDLPGYGWAKASKENKMKWQKMIEDYIFNRKELSLLLILIDSRLEPQKIDLDFITEMGINAIPIALAFTKVDKISKNKIKQNVDIFLENLQLSWQNLPPHFITSAKSGQGREELLNFFDSFINNN